MEYIVLHMPIIKWEMFLSKCGASTHWFTSKNLDYYVVKKNVDDHGRNPYIANMYIHMHNTTSNFIHKDLEKKSIQYF